MWLPGARMGGVMPADLTDPERLLWERFPRGGWVDLRAGDARDELGQAAGWGPQRVVRAQVLQALLLGGAAPQPGQAPGLRLRGARVTGRLDLMGAALSWPLVCESCVFDSEIRLVEASVRTIRIVGCQLPHLNATRMRLDGILNLQDCVIPGVLRLDQVKITGQLCRRAAKLGRPGTTGEALAASELQVDGGLDGVGLRAHGTVWLRVAQISGSVDFTSSQISFPAGRAFALDYTSIGGQLDCRAIEVHGQTSLHNTQVTASLVFTGAQLDCAPGEALSAGGLTVGGAVHITDGFT